MVADIVLHAPQKHKRRHKQNCASIGTQHASHLFQTSDIVIEMFNHIKAGDQVTIILCPAKNGQPVAYAGSGDPGTKVIFADGRELDFTDKTVDKTAP